jgi:hypothetical protein
MFFALFAGRTCPASVGQSEDDLPIIFSCNDTWLGKTVSYHQTGARCFRRLIVWCLIVRSLLRINSQGKTLIKITEEVIRRDTFYGE